MSTLDALVQTIASGVQDIQSAAAQRATPYPTTDVPLSSDGEQLQTDLAGLAAPVLAAAWQLIATLQHPQAYLVDLSFLAFVSSSLAGPEAAFVPDVLREYGAKGLHVNEIAAVRNVDPGKLGRILRYLASRHIFEEAAPDVFRNNRISAAMCTGKPVQEILGSPIDRWDGTNGVAALMSLGGENNQRGNAWLAEHLLDPATAHSQEPNEAAWQRGQRTKLTMFEWMELPENALQLRKFGIAMRATTNSAEHAIATRGFEWQALPDGTLVVDVGGGVGNLTMALAKAHRHLRYIVQDRPAVAKEGEQLWKANQPGLLESGTVRLQGTYDCLLAGTVADESLHRPRLLRGAARQERGRLRRALRHAQLVGQVREPHPLPPPRRRAADHEAGHHRRRRGLHVARQWRRSRHSRCREGAGSRPATGWTYGMDICMMSLSNCQERTLGQFVDLLKGAGWKLERVCRLESPLPQQLICSPL